MSEQKQSFMAELDAWTEKTVFEPLHAAWRYNSEDWDQETPQETFAKVKLAIREKVLESYKNGLKAPSRPLPAGGVRKEPRYAQAKTR